jgi:AraC-like DNA-binding protein
MNLSLSFPDLLLFASAIFSLFTVILLLKKINLKNYVRLGILAINFALTTGILILILLFRFQFTVVYSFYTPLILGVIFFLGNVFHYFSVQFLISNSNQFKWRLLIHFLPILFIEILGFFFLVQVHSVKKIGYNQLFETQHLMFTLNDNYVFGLFRVIQPLIYLILGGFLVNSFCRSSKYLATPKPTRIFILVLYFQKIVILFWFLFGFIGFNLDLYKFSYISIAGFSISSLLLTTYVMLNPDLFLQIIKPNSSSKKTGTNTAMLPDLAATLNRIMEENKWYLDANYSLTNLSADTDITANTIREIITAEGYKNFSAYINSFRIAHAEQLISNGYLDTYSIESLCKDSGFQSEATFYRVFKKIHERTPKEFSYTLKQTV